MNADSTKILALIAALLAISPTAPADQHDDTADAIVADDAGATPASAPAVGPEQSAPGDPEPGVDPIDAAYNRFLRLRDEGHNDDATAAALQVAELTQDRFGADSLELAAPLINLAVMQSLTGDLAAAEQNYRAAIGVIERREGMLSPRLINPLTGLGHSYNRAGMYEKAIESFERALRLNNIEQGFTNFGQFGIQDGLTESYVGMREFEDANFYQEAQLEIYQRKFGREDPEVVPAMYKLAEWYSRAGNLEQSALTYRGADRILREQEGDASANRTEALMGLARLYERQGNRPAASSTMRKAVKLLDENPEPDRLLRAKVEIALGDLYSREARVGAARVEYEDAWADLSSDDSYLDQRDKYFELPVRLAGGPFPDLDDSARGRTDSELKEGYVVIRYTVDGDGRAQDVIVLESDPAGLMEDALLTTYRRSLYRPRFVDGVSVATENLLSEHAFRYGSVSAPDNEDRGELPRPESKRGRIERPGSTDSD